MKTLLLLIYSFTIFANITIDECSEKAMTYFSTEGIPTIIPNLCGQLIEKVRTPDNFAKSVDGKIEISAYKNMIYINDDGVDRFIAGNLSRVHNVLSLKFEESESRIYILNENQERQREVLSYKCNISGNVSPIRSLETREIENATSISIEDNYIHVISSTHDWKKSFNKNADPNGKKDENSSGVLREISGSFD
jgi:hypothetical protein